MPKKKTCKASRYPRNIDFQLKFLLKTGRVEETIAALKALGSVVPKEVADRLTSELEEKKKERKDDAEIFAKSIQVMTKVEKENYGDLSKANFSREAALKVDELSLLALSTLETRNCIAWAKDLYETGNVDRAQKVINILTPLVDDEEDKYAIAWAKLVQIETLFYRPAASPRL